MQRVILPGVPAVAALVFWRRSDDVFNLVKATLIALGAVALVAAGAVRVARTRRLHLAATPLWWPLGLFVAGLVVATLGSGAPWRAVVGNPGRHTGAAMYLVYAALLVCALHLHRDRPPVRLVQALLLAAVPVCVYGLLQALGADPFAWRAFESGPQVTSSFGNADFLAAWLGVVAPLAWWGAMAGRGPSTRPWASAARRAACAAIGVLALAVAAMTHSLQGIAGAAVGTGVLGAVWLAELPPRRRSIPLWVRAVGVGALAVVALVILSTFSPFRPLLDSAAASFQSRTGKWETAWTMLAHRPLTGVGLSAFGDWFNFFRSPALAAQSGLARSVDAPHNVPLQMLAEGGLPLGAGYLGLVAVTGAALVRGLRRAAAQHREEADEAATPRREERLLLAALGGAWCAYQLQSLVSIDVPPLAVLHWILAGAIVARGACPRLVEIRLPGAPAPRRRRDGRTSPALATRSLELLGAIVLFVVAAAAAVVTPLRADLAAGKGRRLAAAGQVQPAVDAFERASAIAFWEGSYPSAEAKFLTGRRLPGLARSRYEEAARREPRDLTHAINAARLSEIVGETDQAERWYARALELDPRTPEVLVEVARFRVAHGQPGQAVPLLENALALRGDNADWWAALAEARGAGGGQ